RVGRFGYQRAPAASPGQFAPLRKSRCARLEAAENAPMHRSASLIVLLFSLALASSCATADSAAPTGSRGAGPATGAGGGAAACEPCVTDKDCASGSLCGQFDGDTYCATDCSKGEPCAPDHACMAVAGFSGAQIQICVPTTNVCAATGSSSTTG